MYGETDLPLDDKQGIPETPQPGMGSCCSLITCCRISLHLLQKLAAKYLYQLTGEELLAELLEILVAEIAERPQSSVSK